MTNLQQACVSQPVNRVAVSAFELQLGAGPTVKSLEQYTGLLRIYPEYVYCSMMSIVNRSISNVLERPMRPT